MQTKHTRKDLADILKFLSPGTIEIPQIVLADKNTKRAIVWYPGEEDAKIFLPIDPQKYLIGLTGKYFIDPEKSFLSQKSKLYFLTVDIDHKDNPGLENKFEDLKKVIGEDASIRSSTSGKGYHLIFRLEKPVENPNRILIRNIMNPYLKKIESVGIHICSFGINTYLLGGFQDWLYKTDNKIPISDENLKGENILQIRGSGIFSFDEFLNSTGKKLFRILKKRINYEQRFLHQDIYIKDFYDALKGTDFEFRTKSPMASNNKHINGFVQIDDHYFYIYAAADGCLVAKYFIFS